MDQDANLAAGLNGKALLDPVKRVGDAFERFQPLNVGFDHFPPGAGTGAADGIGGCDDEGLHGLWLLFTVVGGDGVDDLTGAAQSLGDVGADQGVGALDFMIDRLADVVQQAGGLGDVDIGADLGGQGG
jgi:hypothetical protein